MHVCRSGSVVYCQHQLACASEHAEIPLQFSRDFRRRGLVIRLVAIVEVFLADSVHETQVAWNQARQLGGILHQDVESRLAIASVASDGAHEIGHLLRSSGPPALCVVFVGIDDVQVCPVVASIQQPISVAQDDGLPGGVPVAHLVVPRPVVILGIQPGRGAGLPVVLPIETVVLGLADAHIGQHDLLTARAFLELCDLRSGKLPRLGAVGGVVHDDQIVGCRTDRLQVQTL